MAHRGRAYPLSPNRGMNADARYPRWCPARYDFFLPPATGTFAIDLSQIIVRSDTDVWTLNGCIYRANFAPRPDVAAYILTVAVGWDNDDTAHPRLFRAGLDLVLPVGPIVTTIAQWSVRYEPDRRLDQASLAIVFVHDASAYSPASSLFIDYVPWF